MILNSYVPFQIKGSEFFPKRAVPYSMENHLYHIKWPPFNATIYITHMRNLHNERYTNASISENQPFPKQ